LVKLAKPILDKQIINVLITYEPLLSPLMGKVK